MFVISSRSAFHDAHAFASSDRIRSFATSRSSPDPVYDHALTASDLADRLHGQRVLVLVHGYNHALDDAMSLFQRVKQTADGRFPDAYDAVVGYTWPAGASRLDYFAAKSRVEEAGRRLLRWLEWLWAAGCTVDVACHSMGARVITAAVRDAASFQARNVFVLAAAAGSTALDDLHSSARHVYVFHTRDDTALGRWYWLFEWETPIGFAGIAPDSPDVDRWPNVTVVDCTRAVKGHYDYLVSTPFINYLAHTLDRTRSRPPQASDACTPTLEATPPHGSPDQEAHPTPVAA